MEKTFDEIVSLCYEKFFETEFGKELVESLHRLDDINKDNLKRMYCSDNEKTN